MQVENDNKGTMPPIAKESSKDEGDGAFIVDEDMDASPLLPLAEFHNLDNATSFADVEDVNGDFWLKQRPHLMESGSIIYNADSPLNSDNPLYGLTLETT